MRQLQNDLEKIGSFYQNHRSNIPPDSAFTYGQINKALQGFFRRRCLIVAERQSGLFLDCRVRRWTAGSTLAIKCGTASIALDVHLEDG